MDREPQADTRRRFAVSALACAMALAGLSAVPGAVVAQPVPDLVMAALAAMRASYPRTVNTRVRLKDREVMQTWQAVSARRFRFAQTPPENVPELMVWDDNAYLRQPAGWYRKALNATPIELGSTDWMRRALANALSGTARLPDAVVAGVTLRRYEGHVDYEDAVGVYAGRFELWLDDTSSLPVRCRFDGSYAGRPLSIDTRIDYVGVPVLVPPQPVLNPP